MFPLLVAAGSTLAALGLFFSTTVPALNEHHHLQRIEAEVARTATGIRRDLETEALHRIGLELDPQSLMVELDRRGIFAGALWSEAISGETQTR